jgi:FtsH-binding integral membrane protein
MYKPISERFKKEYRNRRIKTVAAWTAGALVVLAVFWFIMNLNRWIKPSDEVRNMQPIHWLALAIFLGCVAISNAINKLADTIKNRKP